MRRRQWRAAGRAGLAGCLVAVAAACAAGGGARAAAPSTTGRSRGTTVATTKVEPTTSTVPVVPSTTVAPTTVAPTSAPGTTTPAVPVSPLVAGGVGRVVVLDPGHDGGNASHPAEIDRQVPAGGFTKACDTTGTQTDGGYPEHAFTFDVALRVATLLRGQGLTVVLTRPDDAGVGPCVDERAAIGNRAGAAAVVSIHADGGPADGRGFHVLEPAGGPGAVAAIVAPSARLGLDLRDAFRSGTPMPTSTYAGSGGLMVRGDLAGLNLSTVPKVFIECGNMRNGTDAALLGDPAFRQQAAQAIAAGIARYLAT